MSTAVKMPMLSMSMSEGTLLEWLVEDGAQVAQGQLIYTVESEKAVVEIEAPAAGVLKQIAEAGAVLPVGADVAEIV
jgi:pyruvate/2-oxoglutarate dehydrogenase complex dihydrolipoamide acyltransferase (E2) component